MSTSGSDERFDAVVLGAGPGGRGVARRLAKAGMSVAMVEQELVGGECPFWACIPSKALLRPAEAIGEVGRVAGLAAPAVRFDEVAEYRDYMNSGLDDTAKARTYALMGVKIVRGHGRIAGPGEVDVEGHKLLTERIVVATGTTSAVPPIDGLDGIEYWTNREATTLEEVPRSAIVLGGGPVGVELGQMMSRFGSAVAIVEGEERLLPREDASVGDRLAGLLAGEGIELHTGRLAKSAEKADSGVGVTLDDGARIEAERLVMAVGRKPRVEDIGLDRVGIEPGERGIEVDEHCRAGDGVWAVGDVTGVSAFTHVAAYQSRVAFDDMLGRSRPADYRAVPRVVFCDPEVAAVGLTTAQAEERGLRTEVGSVELSRSDRTETYGRGLEGHLGLLADADREVLIGAWAVGPLAGEWIHSLVLAIKAEVPIGVLRDTMMQFPSFSELIPAALGQLGR